MRYEPLIPLREALRSALPERSFLKRARTDALFVTNARPDPMPVHWLCTAEGSVTALTPDEALLAQLRAGIPSRTDHLSASLERTRSLPPTPAADRCLLRGLKLTESRTPAALAAWEREVRELAALSLRTGAGSAYACACLLDILKGERP